MYDDFNIIDVISVAGYPAAKMRSSSADFDCPVCGGKSKLHVNINAGRGGVCRCNKCNVGGDKVDLYALIMRGRLCSCSPYTSQWGKKSTYMRPTEDERKWALQRLVNDLNLARQNPDYTTMIRKQTEAALNAKERVSNTYRTPAERNAVYTAFLKLLDLSDDHRTALLERGLSEAEIERIMFRTTPTVKRPKIAQQLIDMGFNLDGIAGFFKRKKIDGNGEVIDKWSTYCPDTGYFVPIRDKDGYIISMQIRLNKPTTDNNKYYFFSSNRDTLELGTQADSDIHVEMCAGKPRYLYVVEGPIKAYVAHYLYKRIYGRDDIIILAIPGTSNQGGIPALMDWLEQYDIERVIEFFDLDKFVNENVARDRNNLEVLLKISMKKWYRNKAEKYAAGTVKPKFASFPQDNYRHKGIDDHLKVIYDELVESGQIEPGSD